MMLRLLREHYPFRSFVFLMGEGGAILIALMAGILLRLGSTDYILVNPLVFALKAVVVVLVCQGVLFLSDLYDFDGAETQLGLLLRILKALAAGATVLAVIYYLVPQVVLGRGAFALAFALMGGVVFAWRSLYLWLINARGPRRNVLIVGAEELAVDIAREIIRRKDWGARVVGFLSGDPALVGRRILNPSVIGTYEHVCRIVDEQKVDKVIVALKERRGFPVGELLGCKMKGIQVIDGISYFEQLTGKLMVESLKPSNLIFSEGFRGTRAGLAAKRLLDVTLSALMLVAFLPVMALAAVAVKLDSAGPVLFRQERVGEWGRRFYVKKFRSMRVDAEEQSGPVWASEDDPRITRVGRWLRKFRIDELPQLWNVLSGDMSLVGPRPERPYFVEQLTQSVPYYDQRVAARPGITGWAQVKYNYGASEEDSLEKLKYDLYYVKHHTIWLDLLILFETVRLVLFGRGSR